MGAFYTRTAIRRLSEFSACLIPAIPVTSTSTTPGSPGAVVTSSPTIIGSSSSSSATPVPAASAALVVSAVLVGVARRVTVSWAVVLGPAMWRWLLVIAPVASAVSAAAATAASPRVPSLRPVSIRAVVHIWGRSIVPGWSSTHVRWGNIAWSYVCSKGVGAVVAGVGYMASTSSASPASTTAVRMEWCSSE